MKITKKILRDMILQEMDVTLSAKDNPNLDNMLFKIGPFATLIENAYQTLHRLEGAIRDSQDFNQTVYGALEKDLKRITDKISYIQQAADLKIKGSLDKPED